MPRTINRRRSRQKNSPALKFSRRFFRILSGFKRRFVSLGNLFVLSKKRKKQPIPIAALLFLFGIFLLLFPTIFKNFINRPSAIISKLSSAVQMSAKTDLAKEPIHIDTKLLAGKEAAEAPLRIVIPMLSIDLSIVEARVVDGYWEISQNSASHGVGSAYPGELGNTVIFAHAREGLFLPLKDIKKDQLVYVLTKDRWFRYKVDEIKFVDPQQVEVIAPTSDETLTLYTCSGFLDNKRLIVTSKPDRP